MSVCVCVCVGVRVRVCASVTGSSAFVSVRLGDLKNTCSNKALERRVNKYQFIRTGSSHLAAVGSGLL